MCLGAGTAFVIGVILLAESSSARADSAMAMLWPGEALGRLFGFAAHDLLGFIFVIPGNIVLYGAALFLLIEGSLALRKKSSVLRK